MASQHFVVFFVARNFHTGDKIPASCLLNIRCHFIPGTTSTIFLYIYELITKYLQGFCFQVCNVELIHLRNPSKLGIPSQIVDGEVRFHPPKHILVITQ
jgi:hypothetical protein